ncbi:Pimeloyl-ACP methyl ester carboxylesterase [Streptoalloteichus tenebrarius]|uniref:Pimeloyl-ACP methyl ester carboxylesterase n=1 Tax=Streptoalloteichus tenebrarius (strain ATCC 17920 / DSM 40477 / JCM 4838 / CBS 697.72 / NBRC 16177 / NCIMB 11028 / NRRL B-12390 / A12253. 1 / ISP 5477) TaxID=1933 RepID=A0ABT1HZW4_STRSD|nr:alpha/beta fold hydrolase [Streptoalloteichus tenebrarius]MCP2261030.1 Pimeloyl-ACP methyl ester carboxylesterase [Streptoalloteichus tenebrarius]BFF03177.1 alpha/beta hydrolase [Streptoalloteichus tenebrarius]
MIDKGIGPALVLLHAFPADAGMWDAVRAPLAERVRLVTPDQRGLGRTPLDENGQLPAPDLDVVAEDLLRLLDHLGIDRAILGGCSMGGYVAMAVLRKAPERVAGLVLASTKAVADTEEQRAARLAVAARAEADGTAGWLADSVLPTLVGETSHAERPDVVAAVRALVERQPATGVAWAQRAMAARPDSTETLRSARVPALVLAGEEDRLTPPEVARDLVGLMPRSELVVLPRCGHLAPVEAPEAFAAAVLDWLPRALG